jgi:hypothetical protein
MFCMAAKRQDAEVHKPSICEDKRRLAERFVGAIRELVELNEQQMQAAIKGDDDFSRFDDLIQMARGKKAATKDALMTHMEAHGCLGVV